MERVFAPCSGHKDGAPKAHRVARYEEQTLLPALLDLRGRKKPSWDCRYNWIETIRQEWNNKGIVECAAETFWGRQEAHRNSRQEFDHDQIAETIVLNA